MRLLEEGKRGAASNGPPRFPAACPKGITPALLRIVNSIIESRSGAASFYLVLVHHE